MEGDMHRREQLRNKQQKQTVGCKSVNIEHVIVGSNNKSIPS